MEESFKIRTYSFNELALIYFPYATRENATRQLRKWITSNKTLETKLQELGFKNRIKLLTPAQVKLVVEMLGEP